MKKILLVLAIFMLMLFSGCSQSVEEIKSDEYVGKVVSVKGTVIETIKIGDLSVYVLMDENGDKINVASKRLPAEGDRVTAKGVLNKKAIIGYYIDVDE